MKFSSILLAVILSSCSPSFKVFSDYDKSVDISNYKNYNWISEQAIEGKGINPLYYNELSDKRIKAAANKELQLKGFVVKNTEQPLEMHYHIVVENKTLVTIEPKDYNFGTYWLTKKAQEYPYKQGTLILDLMDTKSKALVWRGWATGLIEDKVRKNPEQAINEAVNKIFKSFPYKR